jgi:hypothetical protein
MLLMIRMAPLHFGQTKESTSEIFCINRAQFRRKILSSPLRLDDVGNGVIVSFHLQFPP